MSRLEELIQQYCPDGVEYRPIWSLTAWDKKFNGIDKSKQKKVIKYNYLLAADLKSYQVDGGTVKLLTTNISNLYTTEELAEELASDGEVVAIPWGGNPIVQYYKGRFLTADNRIATSLDTTLLNNKFLYYCMLNQMELIASFYRGSGIKHPEMAKVLDLEIPVPPLPVQEEIVRILDTFTELQAELQAELQKRLQQYAYYKNKLLSGDYPTMKIGDITRVFSASRVHKNEWKTSGVPFYRSSDVMSFHRGEKNTRGEVFISEELFEKLSAKSGKIKIGDLLVTGGGSIGVPYLVSFEPLYVKDADLLCIVKNDILDNKFLYHYMRSEKFKDYLSSITHDATIAHYTISQIKETPVPVPTWDEQQRIITILDKFDTLTNDLSQGLPAEIEARRKQYEYYRDILLTFKKKA